MSEQSLPREYPSDEAVDLFVDYAIQRLIPVVRQGEKRLGLPACEIGDLLEFALPFFYCDGCEVHSHRMNNDGPTAKERQTELYARLRDARRLKGKRLALRVIRGGLDRA